MASGSTSQERAGGVSTVRDTLGGDQPVLRLSGAERQQLGVVLHGISHCSHGTDRDSCRIVDCVRVA